MSGAKIANGAAWIMAARLVDRVIGLASTIILARLLVPADFGLVAMATAVIALIDLANSFGFEIPLIRATNPPPELYNSVWTLNVLFGLFCSVTIVATAYPAALFYGDPRLFAVMCWLAIAWLVGSLTNVGVVDFRRNLDFAKEFQMLMASRLTTFCITVPSAIYFRSYWALIVGMVFGRVLNCILSYKWHPYRPKFSLQSRAELFSFSRWIFVEKIAGFGNARAADFLLGRIHGPTALGTFRIADEIGALPSTELIAPINRALLPGASKMAESGRDFAEITLKASGVVAIMLIPACLGIAAVADPLILTMLGDKWVSAVPILRILAVSSILAALWGNQATLLLASGRPQLPGTVTIGRLVLFIPLVFLWVPSHSGIGLAWAILASSAVAYVGGLLRSLMHFQVKPISYIRVLVRPMVSSILMYVVVSGLLRYLAQTSLNDVPVLQFLIGVAVGVVVYILAMLAMYKLLGRGDGAEQIILERVSIMWANLRVAGVK